MANEAGKVVQESVEKKPDKDHMHIKVYAPFKVYYNDMGTSISAANGTGDFDILPGHHNFMTLVDACDVVVRNGDREDKIPIAGGIMHVKADEVRLFLDV